jgi:plastocyanin
MSPCIKTAGYRFAIPTLILGLIGLSACSILTPQTTRTGEIRAITIEEGLEPTILTVGIGDEVRWVNHRTLPVQIDFLNEDLDTVSCQRGFTNWIGVKKESTIVGSSESVSVCFSKAGEVTYNVRMDSALPGGQQIVKGEIRVGKDH